MQKWLIGFGAFVLLIIFGSAASPMVGGVIGGTGMFVFMIAVLSATGAIETKSRRRTVQSTVAKKKGRKTSARRRTTRKS